MKEKMIFHHPLPLDKNSKSASGIRPIKMVQAFERLGYEVILVIGYGKERKVKINTIKKRIISGEKFEFIYSESSTQPTLLTERNHIPVYPFVDFSFFSFCKKNGIKIGLFYRDIYWAFPEYGRELSFFKRNIAKFFYRYDLLKYNSLVDIVYLPSMQMAKYIPIVSKSMFKALPPGHDEYNVFKQKDIIEPIELLYIGGLGSHYQMHKLFSVLKDFSQINFTLCTRKSEWENIKDEYDLSKNIFIVHKSGEELKQLYKNSDISMLFVKPQEYREFAAPVKLFEYIGKEKPIIASRGTLAGEYVEQYDIGWNIEYDENELAKLFLSIIKNLSLINEKKLNILKIKLAHTWEARASQVQKDLSL